MNDRRAPRSSRAPTPTTPARAPRSRRARTRPTTLRWGSGAETEQRSPRSLPLAKAADARGAASPTVAATPLSRMLTRRRRGSSPSGGVASAGGGDGCPRSSTSRTIAPSSASVGPMLASSPASPADAPRPGGNGGDLPRRFGVRQRADLHRRRVRPGAAPPLLRWRRRALVDARIARAARGRLRVPVGRLEVEARRAHAVDVHRRLRLDGERRRRRQDRLLARQRGLERVGRRRQGEGALAVDGGGGEREAHLLAEGGVGAADEVVEPHRPFPSPGARRGRSSRTRPSIGRAPPPSS